MKVLYILLMLTGAPLLLCAQESNEIIRVKTARRSAKPFHLPDGSRYDRFAEGKVIFKNGRTGQAKLNYSFVFGEIMFIDPKNDTLLLSDPQFVDHVVLMDKLYYWQKGSGHIEVFKEFEGIGLGRKVLLVQAGNEKYAAYNQYSSTSATSSYSTFVNSNGEYQFLQGNYNIVMRKTVQLYLMDQNNLIYPAQRPAIFKLFPRHKKRIATYLKEQNPDLNTESDLVALIEFCTNLR